MPLSLIIIAVVLLFGFVLLFGAPYLPTMRKQSAQALDMLALKPGQILLELGCGDGRVAKAAASRGLNVVGYELNPLLALIAWINTGFNRGKVRIIWGNYWQKAWPDADAIFVFLLDKYMKKLDKIVAQKAKEQKKPIKLLSYTFQIPGHMPVAARGALFLYKYPK